MRATLDEAGRAHYDTAIDNFRASLERFGKSAAPPEKVAAAILDALTASRAPTRTTVGLDSKLVSTVVRRLPARLRDAVLAKVVGI